ncbi:unnamed protein product, partial [Ixodes pacificus]
MIACTNLACVMTYEVPSPGHATYRDLVPWAVDVEAEALWPAGLRRRSEDLPSVPCKPPTESEVGLPDEMREVSRQRCQKDALEARLCEHRGPLDRMPPGVALPAHPGPGTVPQGLL